MIDVTKTKEGYRLADAPLKERVLGAVVLVAAGGALFVNYPQAPVWKLLIVLLFGIVGLWLLFLQRTVVTFDNRMKMVSIARYGLRGMGSRTLAYKDVQSLSVMKGSGESESWQLQLRTHSGENIPLSRAWESNRNRLDEIEARLRGEIGVSKAEK